MLDLEKLRAKSQVIEANLSRLAQILALEPPTQCCR